MSGENHSGSGMLKGALCAALFVANAYDCLPKLVTAGWFVGCVGWILYSSEKSTNTEALLGFFIVSGSYLMTCWGRWVTATVVDNAAEALRAVLSTSLAA